MSGTARTLSYWLSGSLLALTLALILEGASALPLLLTWLIGINLFTLLFYSIDKLNSIWADGNPERQAKNVRIPELALLLLALLGGSLGAAAAIILLPHKTNKFWFIMGFLLVLAIQGVAVFLLQDQLPSLSGLFAS
jgi:uncharacterized membrane protein YsdA (DUF1294 family)